MSEQDEKRIYWTEGVTRKGVQYALTTNKHPVLYRRSTRRALVAVYTVLVLLAYFSSLLGTATSTNYIPAASAFFTLIIFFVLRHSVRLIADAPAELLDERLVVIRDRAYLSAYRWLSFVFGITIGIAIARDFSINLDPWWPVVVAIALVIGGLPSMVLAWRLPSEEPVSDEFSEAGR